MTAMMKRPRAPLLLAALVTAAVTAQADDGAAQALFLAGREAAGRGDHATACAKFQESNRLDPAVGTVFNIGDCSEKLGKTATAWRAFREVQQRLPSSDERVAIAKKRADALEPRLARLTITLAPGVTQATVRRDGVEFGAASLRTALPIDPGEHVVEVTATGRRQARFPFTIREAEQRTLEVSPGPADEVPASSALPPAASTRPPPSEPRSDDALARRRAGFVTLGVSGAVFATGAVLGWLTLQKKSTADDNCLEKRCNQKGYDAVEAGRTLGGLSAAGLGLGAVGLAVGGYLLASSPARGDARLAPWVGSGSAGLAFGRSF